MVVAPVSTHSKRELILETTLKLVSEQGFHGTPISQIATQAGIGAGTIYRYFQNKEELIEELYKELRSRTVQAMMEGQEEVQSIRDRFFRIWQNLIDHYLQYPDQFIFLEQYTYSPFVRNMSRRADYTLLKPLFAFFHRAVREKILRPFPLDVHFALAHGPVVALVKQHLFDKSELTPSMMDDVFQACWRAAASDSLTQS